MAIVIKASIQNVDSVNAQFKTMLDQSLQVKKNIQGINAALRKTIDLATKAGEAFGGWPNTGGGGGSGGGGGKGAANRPWSTQGQEEYNARRRRNADYAKHYADMYGPKKQPMNPIMSALMRSRVDSKGNLMPLVMDIAKLLPPEMLAAVTATIVAFKVLSRVVTDVDGTLGSWRSSMTTGGGDAGTVRAATRVSQFIGQDVGGIGKNLASGYGPIAAAGAGVSPISGPFAPDIDYNNKGLKILDYIRRSKDFDQARRRAEMVGAPEAASVNLLRPETYAALRNTQQDSASMENLKTQAEMNANMIILSDNLKSLEVEIGGPLIDALNLLLAGINDIVDPEKGAKEAKHALRKYIPGYAALDDAIYGKGSDTLDEKDDHKKALSENTDAIENLSKSINQGINGGGQRANSAVGSKMNPLNPSYTDIPYGIPG